MEEVSCKVKGNLVGKLSVFREGISDIAKDAVDFDKVAMKSKEEYLSSLIESHVKDRELLLSNLEMADSVDEREKIRMELVQLRQEEYDNAREYMNSVDEHANRHREFDLKLVLGFLLAMGVVKYKKNILSATKKLIVK